VAFLSSLSIPPPITPPSIVSDNSGGVICAWLQTVYNQAEKKIYYYVKATRLDEGGDLVWTVTITSVGHRLGNPRVAVVDNYVVVVYDSTEAPDDWNDPGGSSFLRAKKLDKDDGSEQSTITIRSVSNEEVLNGKYYWYWDFMDYPLAVYADTLYVCEWTAKRIRNKGCDVYNHACILSIGLHKLIVSPTSFEQVWGKELVEKSFTENLPVGAAIENFPIRAPVITARKFTEGGAVVVYTEADYFDSIHNCYVDERDWKLKIRYVLQNGEVISDFSFSDGKVHTPDVITDGQDGCIITYSSYSTGSKVHTVRFNQSCQIPQAWGGPKIDGGPYYNCGPRIAVTHDQLHFIVVWADGEGRERENPNIDWDINAQRRRIDNGIAE